MTTLPKRECSFFCFRIYLFLPTRISKFTCFVYPSLSLSLSLSQAFFLSLWLRFPPPLAFLSLPRLLPLPCHWPQSWTTFDFNVRCNFDVTDIDVDVDAGSSSSMDNKKCKKTFRLLVFASCWFSSLAIAEWKMRRQWESQSKGTSPVQFWSFITLHHQSSSVLGGGLF